MLTFSAKNDIVKSADIFVGTLTGSGIVESNPGKFKLGDNELQERRGFVERTRGSVQVTIDTDFIWYFGSPQTKGQKLFNIS